MFRTLFITYRRRTCMCVITTYRRRTCVCVYTTAPPSSSSTSTAPPSSSLSQVNAVIKSSASITDEINLLMNTIACMSEEDRKRSLDTIVTPLFEALNDKPTGETIYDVHCNEAWVTDEMINAFVSSAMRKLQGTGTVCLSTYFYDKLIEKKVYDFNRVKRYLSKALEKTPLSDLKRLIIPINITRQHWLLAVVSIVDGTIHLMDSSYSHSLDSQYYINLKRYLSDAKIVRKTCATAQVNVPRQTDSYTCGLRVCAHIWLTLENVPAVQINYPDNWIESYFRPFMIHCIALPYVHKVHERCPVCLDWYHSKSINCSRCNEYLI